MMNSTRQFVVDAKDKVLGRLAVEISMLVRVGSELSAVPDKPQIFVTNVGLMRLSGTKVFRKQYYSHTGFPGGLKTVKMSDAIAHRPRRVLLAAVSGMLPKTKLRGGWLRSVSFVGEQDVTSER